MNLGMHLIVFECVGSLPLLLFFYNGLVYQLITLEYGILGVPFLHV